MSSLLSEREYTEGVKDLLMKLKEKLDNYYGKTCGGCDAVRTSLYQTLDQFKVPPDRKVTKEMLEEREDMYKKERDTKLELEEIVKKLKDEVATTKKESTEKIEHS